MQMLFVGICIDIGIVNQQLVMHTSQFQSLCLTCSIA